VARMAGPEGARLELSLLLPGASWTSFILGHLLLPGWSGMGQGGCPGAPVQNDWFLF
jgi:hypothetical protein